MSVGKQPEFDHKTSFAQTVWKGHNKVVRGTAKKVYKELTEADIKNILKSLQNLFPSLCMETVFQRLFDHNSCMWLCPCMFQAVLFSAQHQAGIFSAHEQK